MKREGSKEGWSQHQDPYTHYSSHSTHDMEVPNSGMDPTWDVQHGVQSAGWGGRRAVNGAGQIARVNNAQSRLYPAQEEVYPAQSRVHPTQSPVYTSQSRVHPAQSRVYPAQPPVWTAQPPIWPKQQQVQSTHGPVHPAQAGVYPALNTNREAFNYGLTKISRFSLDGECSMSQLDPRFTFFSETYGSQSPLQMPSYELLFEDFMASQRKKREEILERLDSLSSKFDAYTTLLEKMAKNIIFQEVCPTQSLHDEQKAKMTLQSDEELESFSSPKLIGVCYETDSDESTQLETSEEHEKIEKSKFVAPPPNILPIFIPLRLTYIVKSNELELKHPPTDSIIEELERKEDGGTILKVEASDATNDKFTKIDLSSQLEECLESLDAMKGSKPHIKYRITIDPTMRTTKEHTKHVSRALLNHFWVNYDALTGRKVKIR